MDKFSLTQEEQSIVDAVKARGGTAEEAKRAIASLTSNGGNKSILSPITPIKPDEAQGPIGEAFGDVTDTIKGMAGVWGKSADSYLSRIEDPNASMASKVYGAGADVMGGIAGTIGEAYMGLGKLSLPQEGEDYLKKTFTGFAQDIIDTEGARQAISYYQSLDPNTKKQINDGMSYVQGIMAVIPPGSYAKVIKTLFKGGEPMTTLTSIGDDAVKAGLSNVDDVTQATLSNTDDVVKAGLSNVDDVVAGAPQTVKGGVQLATETVGGVERAKDKIVRFLEDAGRRNDAIRISTPEVGDAIKSNLNDVVINRALQADDATREAMGKMLDIADDPASTLKIRSLAGGAAADQLNMLDDYGKSVGTKIGDAIDALPDSTIDMRNAFGEVDDVLAKNGISIKDGVLDFSKSNVAGSNEMRSQLQLLYDRLHESGDDVSALLVHSKDSTFAQLKRAARDSGSDFIPIKGADGKTQNAFDLFRNTYRKPLNEISPEMATLNKQYALYKDLSERLDDSIFKTAKFSPDIDPALQAGINLRRIDTEALSQPAFEDVLARLNIVSRELGYKGADPATLTYFANDLRNLYSTPAVVPQGGFTGSIRSAVGDIAKFAKPDTTDQITALRALLNSKPDTSTVANAIKLDLLGSLRVAGKPTVAGKVAGLSFDGVTDTAMLKSRLATLLTPDEMALPDVQTWIKQADQIYEFQKSVTTAPLQAVPVTKVVAPEVVSSPKSTTQRLWDAIRPGSTPNKEGGFVRFGDTGVRLSADETGMLVKYVDMLDSGKPVSAPMADALRTWMEKTGFQIPEGSPAEQSAFLKGVITASSQTTR